MIDACPIAGFDEHYGSGLFHCPSCDGYEARGCDVVALGWSAHIAGFALELLDWAATVKVVTSVSGVYAAGDLTPGYQLVQVAAAKGTTAGVTAAMSLSEGPASRARWEST